jgi:hypothetical protein
MNNIKIFASYYIDREHIKEETQIISLPSNEKILWCSDGTFKTENGWYDFNIKLTNKAKAIVLFFINYSSLL